MSVASIGKVAFDVIYEDNVEIVYKVAAKYCGNHHTAEEIAQSVFMKLYMNMDHVNLDAVRPWLVLTTKYMALNVIRDRKREVLVDELLYEKHDKAPSDFDDSTEDVFIRKLKERASRELVKDIFSALYDLNPSWYEAVTITYVLEKPQKEVAEIMGVKLETLHSMLYRAKKWIRKHFEEQFDHLNKA